MALYAFTEMERIISECKVRPFIEPLDAGGQELRVPSEEEVRTMVADKDREEWQVITPKD